MSPKKVLIVGAGSMGQKHLQVARNFLPRADIRVLRHRRSNEVPSLANGCFHDPREALRFAPQAAVIANPAPFHLPISTKLASLGCHLLVEKPIADDTKGVRNLLELAGTKKIVLQVGYNLRFLQSLQEFRRLVQSGSIGHILSFHAEVGQYLPSWRPEVDYRRTVSACANLGGGVLLELSHEIDYLRWIFGEVAWVSAWTGKVGNLEIDVEDTARLLLGYRQKSLLSGNVGTLAMDFIRADPIRCCVAVGYQGSLRWNGLSGRIDKYSAKKNSWLGIFQKKEPRLQSYTREWKSFLDCIDSGKRPKVTCDDGLAVLKIVEAAKRSNASDGLRVAIAKTNITS